VVLDTRFVSGTSCLRPGIQQRLQRSLEVRDVARHECELVHVGGGRNKSIHGVERPAISLTACDQPSPFIGDCAVDVGDPALGRFT
jgi:hypothetical protein